MKKCYPVLTLFLILDSDIPKTESILSYSKSAGDFSNLFNDSEGNTVECSSGEDNTEFSDNSLLTQLAQWAIKHNITNITMPDLLKVLNASYDQSLPLDART